MSREANWLNLSIAECNEYDNLAQDLGTGLGIPRKPYITGNVTDFFDKYETDNSGANSHFDTERTGSTTSQEIAKRDGKGTERVVHVTGYIRNMSFIRVIDINTAAFLFDPKQINMAEYRARAAKKRALDTKLYGYVPGFRFERHAPSPFGPSEDRFRQFNPLSPFDDQKRYGFVHFHTYH